MGDPNFIISVRVSCCDYSQRVPNNSAVPLNVSAQQGILNFFSSKSMHSRRYFILTVTFVLVYLSDYEGMAFYQQYSLGHKQFCFVVDSLL
jgi:hypothetical protein